MKKVQIILSTSILMLSLLMGWFLSLSDFERHVKIAKNPYWITPLDLSKPGATIIQIKNGEWTYDNGIADVFLVFTRSEVKKDDNYWSKDFKLKVKIKATASVGNNLLFPRLILNYFSPSDEPMTEKTKLWAGWDDRGMEYKLGSLLRFPKEDLTIELYVIAPDDILAKANPRLKIVGDYDPAVLGFINMLKLLRDGLLLLCLVSLIVLLSYGWKYVSKA